MDPVVTQNQQPDYNLTNTNSTNDAELLAFTRIADTCLAAFSTLNLAVNSSLLLVCIGFIRNGSQASSDVNIRRPHYALHFFIFHCILSSVLLETIGTLTNVGFLITGQNILYDAFESNETRAVMKKALDFSTYALFNVSHLNFVFLLNLDKLLYILRPLHYYQLMNRRRVCLICLITWLVASAMASPSITLLDTTAQIRQEAILFAMCVVCPASFDLLSAIIVSTLVYRIQLRDTHAGLSIRSAPSGSRRRLFSRAGTETAIMNPDADSTVAGVGATQRPRPSLHLASSISGCQNFFRHCRVFMRAFTPIIWTCVTTVPYTATMIYLYFGTKDDEEFFIRWTDPSMFKVLRSLGCLYVTYFTGVPLIIIFNNQSYRKRIKSIGRMITSRVRKMNRFGRYTSVMKSASEHHSTTMINGMTTTTTLSITSPVVATAAPLTPIGVKEGRICASFVCTEV